MFLNSSDIDSFVEDTNHAVFAVNGRHDGDAEVDRSTADTHLEAAVLRHPLLGDVELRHHLDTADDGLVVALVDRLHGLVEHAVDPIFDDDFGVPRLDVNIAGAALNRRQQGGVDQLDDRALIGADAVDRQHLVAVLVLLNELDAKVFGRFVQHPLSALRLLQDLANECGHADPHLGRLAELQLELVELDDVGRIGHDDGHAPGQLCVGNEVVAQHQLHRHGPQQVVVDAVVAEVDELEAEALGELLRLRRLVGEQSTVRAPVGRGDGGTGLIGVHGYS